MELKRDTYLPLLAVLLHVYGCTCQLHITRVHLPGSLVVGSGEWIDCEWADGGDTIYALKWYLGLDEFYRWRPAESPPVKTFEIAGDPLRVDLSASVRGRVRIEGVTLGAAGVFRCEVSAEAPSFHTESQTRHLTVIDLPDGKPIITGLKESYQTHDEVHLNCTSLLSQPPADLTFYINDDTADPSWLIHYPPFEDPRTGLETSILGLRFPLWPRLFLKGHVTVKCTAAILNDYFDSSEAIVNADRPFHASIMEGRASIADWLAPSSLVATLLLTLSLLLH